MKNINEKLKASAKKLLADKEVDMIIGYTNGSNALRTTPAFIETPEEVDKLVWNSLCNNILPKYLLDYKNHEGKIGVVVKGCDSRAINRLIHDHQLTADKVVVLGIPCEGNLDANKLLSQIPADAEIKEFAEQGDKLVVKTSQGDLSFNRSEFVLNKCKTCETHNPVVSDILLGEPVSTTSPEDDYADIKAIEDMTPAEKEAYWEQQFSRCIRCYACRNVCSACNCRECCFDQAEPNWVGKTNSASENHVFHITRAMHVAGRCINCGECERVCPMGIPIMKLNKKIQKDMKELFDIKTPGLKAEDDNALGTYRIDDPEEFM